MPAAAPACRAGDRALPPQRSQQQPGHLGQPGLASKRVRRRPRSSAAAWVRNQGGLGERWSRPPSQARGKGSKGAQVTVRSTRSSMKALCTTPWPLWMSRSSWPGKAPQVPSARAKASATQLFTPTAP